MGPTQPLFGAGGGLGGGDGGGGSLGGDGGGGGPGGVCGLLGLGGVRGLHFLSLRFDSLTRGPVTDELPLEVRCFLFRFFFSFSFSFRLPRLLFSSRELGESLLRSLFFLFFSLLTDLATAASSLLSFWGDSFFDGPAFDLLASRKGLGPSSEPFSVTLFKRWSADFTGPGLWTFC